LRLLLVAIPASVAACGDGVPDCVELPAECTPQYEPTFDGVWANTLATSCALSGCHATGAGSLTMGTSPETAYAALLGGGYVKPGDPECSEMVVRIETPGDEGMPPSAMLDDTERCAVAAWVREGADP
jgi:hypothetical protein